MDKISLIDLLVVGIPEVGLAIFISIILLQKEFKISFQNIFKFSASVIGVLGFIYYARSNLSNIAIIGYISTLGYILGFKYLWGFNNRKSILMGSISMYVIMISEFLTYPIYHLIKQYEYGVFFNNRLFFSMPSRLFQILFILIIIHFKLYINNLDLIEKPWCKLIKSSKITICFLITLLVVCIIFNFNYSDLFVKIEMNEINILGFEINLKLYFIETLLFIIICLIFLNRISKYEMYKKILNQEPRKLVKNIIEISSKEELKNYKKMLRHFLDNKKILKEGE